jgi:hypothetical protein
MGRFSEYKGLFAAAAFLNIAMDFILVRPLGITGLFIATILCRGITYLADIWVVYHIELRKPIFDYLSMVAKWIVFLAVTGFLMNKVVYWVSLNGVTGFILRGVLISAVYNDGIFKFIRGRTQEFRFYKATLEKLVFHKMKG